jgi:hypothetical protein
MSGLTAFALGFSAARAIRGRTLAGANILFEPTAPLDVTTPTICVYAGRGRADVAGADLLNGAADARLRFEFFLPASVSFGGVTFDAEASQALLFALLWRQVETALLTDQTPWAEIWRRIRLRIHAMDSARDLFETDKGQKIPCGIVELHCETLAEPPIGEAACGFWADLVAAMRADGPELASLADLFASQILAAPEPLPQWQVLMGLLGATADEVQTIGLGPNAVVQTVTDVSAQPVAAQESVNIPVTPLPGL